jgi:hypothetical protein
MNRIESHFELVLITLLVIAVINACGPVKVDGTVGGQVGVAVSPIPVVLIPPVADFIPFFIQECETMVSGQPCYNTDMNACATCMANALEAALTNQPSPSPSPT